MPTRRHRIFRVMWWSSNVLLTTALLRAVLAWYADRRLRIPRFHLWEHVIRAGTTFFSAPEIKQ